MLFDFDTGSRPKLRRKIDFMGSDDGRRRRIFDFIERGTRRLDVYAGIKAMTLHTIQKSPGRLVEA